MLTSDLFNSVNRITLKGISFQLREILNIMKQRGEWPSESSALAEQITEWLGKDGKEYSVAKEDPITGRQIDYIESLIEERGTNVQCALGECFDKPPMHLADLNRGQASELIEWLKDEEEKHED